MVCNYWPINIEERDRPPNHIPDVFNGIGIWVYRFDGDIGSFSCTVHRIENCKAYCGANGIVFKSLYRFDQRLRLLTSIDLIASI